jgi:hypothetical protein
VPIGGAPGGGHDADYKLDDPEKSSSSIRSLHGTTGGGPTEGGRTFRTSWARGTNGAVGASGTYGARQSSRSS